MNKVIKYIAIAFALFLAVSIIGGCLKVGVTVIRNITDSTSVQNPDGDNSIIYQDEDGGIVFFGLKIGGNENLVSFTKTYENETINSVSIEGMNATLEVKTGDIFKVEVENVPDTYTAEVIDGVLTLKKNSKMHLIVLFTNSKARITVTVPDDFTAEKFRIDTGSGSTYVNGITALHTELYSGSGKVEVLNSSLGIMRADTGSGAVAFTDVDANNLVADTGSGRISYSGTLTGNCVFESGSGSVSLVLKAKEENYNVTADIGSGGLYINGKSVSDTNIRYSDAENLLTFDVGSGRVSVEFIN